jgi:hypothetical protein
MTCKCGHGCGGQYGLPQFASGERNCGVETGHASSGSLMAGFHGFLLLGFLVELNTVINKFKFVIARNRKPKNAVKTIFVKTK